MGGQEVEAKRLRYEKIMSSENYEENAVAFGDWVASNNAPRRSSFDITNNDFKKKNLERPKAQDEEKARCKINSDTMVEMDAERKLHANIIKERAAAQAGEVGQPEGGGGGQGVGGGKQEEEAR